MFGFPRLRTLVAEHDDEEHSLVDFLLTLGVSYRSKT
jgi:hypothetical protein